MARFFRRRPEPAEGEASPAPEGRSSPAKVESWPPRPKEIEPQPERIGIAGSVPFVRLPAADGGFAARAARFRSLAPGHPLEGYLAFLARIADAQGRVAAAPDAAQPSAVPSYAIPAEAAALRAEHGMPPIARDALRDDPAFAAIVTALLAGVDLADMPEAARAAHARLGEASAEDRLDLAVQIFEGAIPVERMAEAVFVSAALQVYLAARASRLEAASLKPVADGVCPACGGAPVSSLIVSWTPADKARYLCCSQCGTLWNHVRIRCTACGAGEGVSYYSLDEVSKDVQAETCTTCQSYIKHLHQHRDPALDPVADDVASYGLDLKVAEEGFRRAGLNLLFVT